MLVVDKVRGFAHCRIETQIFVSVFPLLMTSGNLDSHNDLVGLNRFDGAFVLRSVDVDPIASFQHVRSLRSGAADAVCMRRNSIMSIDTLR